MNLPANITLFLSTLTFTISDIAPVAAVIRSYRLMNGRRYIVREHKGSGIFTVYSVNLEGEVVEILGQFSREADGWSTTALAYVVASGTWVRKIPNGTPRTRREALEYIISRAGLGSAKLAA